MHRVAAYPVVVQGPSATCGHGPPTSDAAMSRHENFLLHQLDAAEWAKISPHLSVVALERWKVIAEPRERIDRVYFPHSGILSFMVDLPEGGAIETGMMGRDGVFGAAQALDERVSLNRVTIQVAGDVSVIGAATFCQLMLQMPRFRKLIFAYDQFFFSYVQQTSACNAVHTVRQRCCRWLLRMHDLAGSEFALTQEFLAQMMGVRRTSVSAIAQDLQAAGLIRYHRGNVTILDLARIRDAACGCEDEVGENFQRIFQDFDIDDTPFRVMPRSAAERQR
jgi:CRP-like cAMP-binding protein